MLPEAMAVLDEMLMATVKCTLCIVDVLKKETFHEGVSLAAVASNIGILAITRSQHTERDEVLKLLDSNSYIPVIKLYTRLCSSPPLPPSSTLHSVCVNLVVMDRALPTHNHEKHVTDCEIGPSP